MKAIYTITGILVLSVAMAACNTGRSDDEVKIPSFEDFIDSLNDKTDTGYVGNRAAELEAVLSSKVFVDLSDKTAEEKAEFIERAKSHPSSAFWRTVTDQIKYARNQLKSHHFELNLERGNPTYTQVEAVDNGVWAHYTVEVDSLVKLKDLKKDDLEPADLVGRQMDILLPADPATVYQIGGMACASDFDGDTLNPDDVHDYNYFYYFDPLKEGCPLPEGEHLVPAPYEVHSSLDAPDAWPEYDLLVADGWVTMVALFGQIDHGELDKWDWGWRVYQSFTRNLENQGFEKTEEYPDEFGATYTRDDGHLKIQVKCYSPNALADHRPRDEVDELFLGVIYNHEIIYYNGHSFYGSLRVLDRVEAYPPATYQIVFMDSCWSYAYYTKQVFRAKSTDSDPAGMQFADVINNTEPGMSGSHKTSEDLYRNIFKGALLTAKGESPENYSWNNLIMYMNRSAELRASIYGYDPELYGVSGVRDNCYTPAGSRCGGDPDPDPDPVENEYRYDADENRGIPDNNPEGISSSLRVDENFDIGSIQVTVQIDHTWIGDLKVKLVHDGATVILHNRKGGDQTNLAATFAPTEFKGMSAGGWWTLTVSDHADMDTGTLKNWSLTLTKAE